MRDKHRTKNSATALVHAAFVITGVVTTMLGPMLPLLSARWGLNDLDAGYFFTAQFVSSLITAAASGILISRFGYRWALFCSLILMAVGAAMLDQKSWQMGMTAVCIYGAGFGLSTPTGNLLIAEFNPENRAAALNLVNFSWGVGAVGAPIAIAFLQHSVHAAWITYAVAAASLALSGCVISAKFQSSTATVPTHSVPTDKIRMKQALHLGIVLCVLFFTYVGTEASIGGWVATHAHRLSFGVGTFWAVMPSMYWGALLLGRASAPLLLRKIRESSLAIGGLLLAFVGTACIFATHSIEFLAAGSALAGLGLSSIFPANLSLLARWFGNRAPKVGSFVFPSASLGGAILPWLVGFISTYSGGLHRGLIVLSAGVAVMLTLYIVYGRSPNVITA